MDNDAAFEKFRECAVEVLQVPADKVTLEARFADDLDADSLDLVELVMALEEAFDVTVEESELEGVETVGQAFELDHRQAVMILGIGPDGPFVGRRVAITGLGAVTCCGLGVDALWEGLVNPTPRGERRVPDFDPSVWFGPKEARRVDRFAQMSVAAAVEALADAGELGADPERSGVIFASGVGGFHSLANEIVVSYEKGDNRVSPFLVPMMMANAGAAHISMRAGWHGPCETVVTACAAATHSIAAAARLVASGRCEVAIGGAPRRPCTTRPSPPSAT